MRTYRVCRVEKVGGRFVFTLPIDVRSFDNLDEAKQHVSRIRSQFSFGVRTMVGIQEIFPDGTFDLIPTTELNPQIAVLPPKVSIVSYNTQRGYNSSGWHVMFNYQCVCGEMHEAIADHVWLTDNTSTVEEVCPITGQTTQVELVKPPERERAVIETTNRPAPPVGNAPWAGLRMDGTAQKITVAKS